MEKVHSLFELALNSAHERMNLQQSLYQSMVKFSKNVNALIDPIKVVIIGEMPAHCGFHGDIFLDRDVSIQIKEYGVIVLKGSLVLVFLNFDIASDVYEARCEEYQDKYENLEKHTWLSSESTEVLISENKVTNSIRNNNIDLEGDYLPYFTNLLLPPHSEEDIADDVKQVVRIDALPEDLKVVGGCAYVVVNDVGICLLAHRGDNSIEGFLVVEEPQFFAEDVGEEKLEANPNSQVAFTVMDLEYSEVDIVTSTVDVDKQVQDSKNLIEEKDKEVNNLSVPVIPQPTTANIGEMSLRELEDFENSAKLSIYQRQQVKKRKEELEKQRRLQEFLHIQSPSSMAEVVTEDLSCASADGTPGIPGSGTKKGSIKDRFEEAKRKQQLQEEERLAKFKNDPRKKVTAQNAVKAIAGNYLAAEHEPTTPQAPVTESPHVSTSGKTLGGARKSLRNMWDNVLETSKTTERDRYVTAKQNTISQFTVTKGTGLVKKRIDEWEELFVQIAASAEEMEEFLRAAQALSQQREFSRKLSGMNLTDMISEFADSCLIPEEFLLGDTRIYNVRLFAPVTQSYLKRMMQESKTNHCALPCGVYGEQSAKPPIDVFAAVIRTNDDKMYIAVTVKAASGREEDPEVYGIRKMVVFGKDTKTQIMEKILNIVSEYSIPTTRNPAAAMGQYTDIDQKSNLQSMMIDEAEEEDDYGDDDVQTGLLDDVHAMMDFDTTADIKTVHSQQKENENVENQQKQDEDIVGIEPEGDLFAGEEPVSQQVDKIPEETLADNEEEEHLEEVGIIQESVEEAQSNEREDMIEEIYEAPIEPPTEEKDEEIATVVAVGDDTVSELADEGDGTWITNFTPMTDRHQLDRERNVEDDPLADRLLGAQMSEPVFTGISSSTAVRNHSSAKSFNSLDDDTDDNEAEPDAAILDDESPTHFAKELCLANVTIARTYLPSPAQPTEFSNSKFNKLKFSWAMEDETTENLTKANHYVCSLNVRNVVTSTACSNVFVLDNLGHGADAYDRHCDLFTGTLKHATTATHYSVTPRGDMCFEWVRGAAASGWLLKWPMQSQRMGRRRWRFFVLRDNLLAYYAGRPTSEEEIATTFSRNSLHLTENSSVTIGRKFLQRCLVVTTPLDTLWIRVRKDYADEVNRWMREINQSVTLQQRPKLVMSKTRVESRWYHESQNFFMVCVDARGYRAGEVDPTRSSTSAGGKTPLTSFGKMSSVDDSLYHGSETRYLKAALFCLRHETAQTTDSVAANNHAATSRRGSQNARRSITETLLGTGKTKALPYNSNSIGSIDPSTVQYSIDIASSDGTRQQLPVVDEKESPLLSCALTVLKLCGDVVLLGGAHGYLAVGRFTTLGLGSYSSNADEPTGRLAHSPQVQQKQKAHSAQIPVGTRRVLMVHPFHHPVHSTNVGYEYPHANDAVITAMDMGTATSLVAVADSRGLVSLWEVPSHYPHNFRARTTSTSASTTTTSPTAKDTSVTSPTAANRLTLTRKKTKRQLRIEAIAAGEDFNEDDYDDDENDEGEDDDEQYAMPLPSTAKNLHPRQRPRLLATVTVSSLESHGYVTNDDQNSTETSGRYVQERITKLVFAQHDHHLYVCTSQRLLLITVDHNHQANRHLHHGHTQQRSLRAAFRDWVVIDRALPDLEGIFDVVPPPAVSAQLFQEKMPIPPDVLDSMMNLNSTSTEHENALIGDATTPVKKKPALFDDDDLQQVKKKMEEEGQQRSLDENEWTLIEWRALEYEGAPEDDTSSSSSGILRSLGVTFANGNGSGPQNNSAMFAKRRCTVSRLEWNLEMFRAALRSLRPIRNSATTVVPVLATNPFSSNN